MMTTRLLFNKIKFYISILILFISLGCTQDEVLKEQNYVQPYNITISPQQVSIAGSKFYVNGQEIFFNGVNTAWQPQSDYSLDFLGRNFDYSWWEAEFERYRQNHINLARVWIHGAGNYSPSLNGDGLVTGASPQFWTDMDQLVAIAKSKGVYLMPTFWSFDMVKDSNSSNYDQYRQIINDQNKTQWYTEYFLEPFLARYEDEPIIMGYDICNEPEHMWRDANCGNLPKDNVVRFIAMMAASINEHSEKPVTVGSMWIIFNSNRYAGWNQYAGNNYSDASLQAQFANSNASLDFWSPHWYQWQSSDGPFDTSIGYWLDNGSKPALIGETPGYNIDANTMNNANNWNITLSNYYKQSYWNGYAGVCAWKNPHENDGYGYFSEIANATNNFYNDFPNLVDPNANSALVSGEIYQIKSVGTGKVLDVEGGVTATSNGANVQQWEYLSQSNQQWQITAVGNGYYSIIAQNSYKALDVLGFDISDGANVGQWEYEGKTNQQWQINQLSNGTYQLINRNSGKALDVANGVNANDNGLNIQQWEVNEKNNQQWQLIPVN
ncbi:MULTISPECIES: RICIN domain-containing protein [Christiangramia]|uniref:Pectate lyase n=1 Tax=Christiangramia flava JLT2011 TaxID=1229726 RepID=A0A1L7I215_9FLAO|nr:RICIN domain-containing protein [Christiangramia flava]APU67657.1 Pectate lyase [Christiangramia flava JLT2011]OSS37581.1 alpha-glucosidase [Christiangramia flava JLT2011]